MKLVVVRGASRQATLAHCESCGSEHLPPVPCGLTFAERIKGIRFGTDWMPSRTDARQRDPDKHRYYDPEPVNQVFGEDSHEKMLEDTQGLGFAQEDRNGDLWHKDRHSGEWERVSDEQLDRVYLAGDTEHEGTVTTSEGA